LTDDEIRARINEASRELFNLRQDMYLGGAEDYNRLTAVRRDIARMKTILRERELMEMMEEDAQ
jgi:large subunit ribosomal protein L29